jgi:hypothetical protein
MAAVTNIAVLTDLLTTGITGIEAVMDTSAAVAMNIAALTDLLTTGITGIEAVMDTNVVAATNIAVLTEVVITMMIAMNTEVDDKRTLSYEVVIYKPLYRTGAVFLGLSPFLI